MKRIVQWIVVIAILVAGWKYAVPWLKEKGAGYLSSSDAGANPCVTAAEGASEEWGSGLAQFVNPPYDLDAWSSFRDGVDSKIAAAESECDCSEEWCTKARGAMRDLSSLVSDLDASIRNGTSPPSDIVRRQEAIDGAIIEASGLAMKE